MPRRLPPTGRRLSARAALPVAFVAAGVFACSDHSSAPTDLEPRFAPGGGGPPVRVDAADPAQGEQGTTLSVRVFGSNFEAGSIAEFALDGVPPGKVRTNSTTFVSADELRAEITIDADAPIGFYDVHVTTPGGKKGVGTELFEVMELGANGTGVVPLDVHLLDSASAITSDGGGEYRDGETGVTAHLERQFSLGTTGASPKPAEPRRMCFEFGERSIEWLGQPSPVCGTAIWNTSRHDNDPDGMVALAPGDSMRVFSRFIFRNPIDDKQVWIQFGDIDDVELTSPNRAVVRRLDLFTWEIEAAGQVARIMKEGRRVRSQVQRDTLGFIAMPFRAVLRAR